MKVDLGQTMLLNGVPRRHFPLPTTSQTDVDVIDVTNLQVPNTVLNSRFASASGGTANLNLNSNKRVSWGVAMDGDFAAVGADAFAYQYIISYSLKFLGAVGDQSVVYPFVCRGPIPTTGIINRSGLTEQYHVLPLNAVGAFKDNEVGVVGSASGTIAYGNHGLYDNLPVWFGVSVVNLEASTAQIALSMSINARVVDGSAKVWDTTR
jgi:hypothetical protein